MELGVALDFAPASLDEPHAIARRFECSVRLVQEAEAVGITSAWIGESYPHTPKTFHLPNPLMLISALAPQVGTMRLGTGVLLLGAWEPARLARESALLDRMLRGRLVLGVGAGPPSLRAQFGRPASSTAAMMDHALSELREGWRAGQPKPWSAAGPPLIVGGGVARAAQRAARMGDGYYLSTTHSEASGKALIDVYRHACEDRGKPAGPVVMNRLCVIASKSSEARQRAVGFLTPVLRRYLAMRTLRRGSGAETFADPVSDDELLNEFCLVGDPDQVGEALSRYRSHGVTTMNLRVAPAVMPDEHSSESLAHVQALIETHTHRKATADQSDAVSHVSNGDRS